MSEIIRPVVHLHDYHHFTADQVKPVGIANLFPPIAFPDEVPNEINIARVGARELERFTVSCGGGVLGCGVGRDASIENVVELEGRNVDDTVVLIEVDVCVEEDET